MNALAVSGSLTEIIRNDDHLYEGNLIYYFRIIFEKAQNVNNPYHNFRHMTHVLYLCYQACVFYSEQAPTKLSPRMMRNLLIAAIFHDFDHPGILGNDDLNVLRAVREMEKYLLPNDRQEAVAIGNIIMATEYPHNFAQDPLSLSAQILRDADLLQVFSSAWIQQIAFGLAAEWNQKPFDILAQQETFLRNLRLQTDWAREMFPEKIIHEKISEIRELLGCLGMKLS